MHSIRRSADRGLADHGWLHSRHSFSFADYHDPQWMGFGNLRVLNDDHIAPGTGFGTHGHRDMEIVSWVLQGALAHRDSMGHGATIVPGELQRMTAGTGVRHSEFNHSADQPAHFLQIWLLPSEHGLAPSYEQRAFPVAERQGRLRRVAAPRGDAQADGAVVLNADATIHAGRFDAGERAALDLPAGRLGYLHVAKGRIEANGVALQAGDAMLLRDEPRLELDRGEGAEVLLFDLAPA